MKILLIQTAFPGDVILATSVLEKLHHAYPEGRIDFLVRAGNETLFTGHPFLNKVIVWYKRKNKISNLVSIILKVRRTKYDLLINMQRFTGTGLITYFSGAKQKAGFDKNPFSFCFSIKRKHSIGDGLHEVDRDLSLVDYLPEKKRYLPRLYPQPSDYEFTHSYKKYPYITIAPASVWFTKQYPGHKWIEFLKNYRKGNVFLIGSSEDSSLCKRIAEGCNNAGVINLAGKLTFLQSAALMQDAEMNFVNDSAPLHLASAVNAPVTAIFCSTVPAFGFGPLSEKSFVVETTEKLYCRPCGLHGFSACPEKHFRCAENIKIQQLYGVLEK